MIVSIGFWNKITVKSLSDKTGFTVSDLWKIIEAQHDIETEHKQQSVAKRLLIS